MVQFSCFFRDPNCSVDRERERVGAPQCTRSEYVNLYFLDHQMEQRMKDLDSQSSFKQKVGLGHTDCVIFHFRQNSGEKAVSV